MAYLEKYFYTYCDYDGVPQKLSIEERDYEGSPMEVRAAPVPFAISYESTSDFKFDPIRPSKANINLLYDESFDFQEFWTSDERQYKVIKYYDYGGVGQKIEWLGFVIPNGFSYLMRAGVKYASIEASDGLNILESIPFVDSNGNPYGTLPLAFNDGVMFPYSLMFTEILRKLELDIDTWIALDVFEKTMLKDGDGREYDPASQAFKNIRTYINQSTRDDIPYWRDKGEVWDCKRVMSALLIIWGAKLYQEDGVWRIKRVNLDANRTDKYWYQYNTLGVYIGREAVTGAVHFPCKSITDILVGRDHTISMDRVFEAVRVNYKYTFERDASQSGNRIVNPNFEDFGAHGPNDWVKHRFNRKVNSIPTIQDTLSGQNTNEITTAMRIPTNADGRRAIRASPIDIKEGEKLYLEFWEKVEGGVVDENWTGVYQLYLSNAELDNTNVHFLVNDGISGTTKKDIVTNQQGESVKALRSKWIKRPIFDQVFFGSYPSMLVPDASGNDFWIKIIVDIPRAPITGSLTLFVFGAAEFRPYYQFQFYYKKPFPIFYPDYTISAIDRNDNWVEKDNYRPVPENKARDLSITGMFLGTIVEEANEPDEHDYIATNDGLYTDRFEPIDIFNGDAGDRDHISNIVVPTANGAELFWNTQENVFSKNAKIGLILAKSVLMQYNKPYRMIDGALAASGLKFGTLITFESLPGIQFIVQRGTFSDYEIEGSFQGTLVQISENEDIEGGFDNGNTLDPIWASTGRTRCQKDGSNLNTGIVEAEEQDINPASETQGDTRWVAGDEDLATCPLGEPDNYLWGSDDASLDTANMVNFPFGLDGDGVSVLYSNPGGEFLYFLHRFESGQVVETITTSFQGNIIADWQYLSDVVVDGFDYRVLRMDYVTGEYQDLTVNFVFSS